jgi:CO/xanthine dehydrogenase Mo-binding subunit
VPQASWASESQLDIIAERLGMDPLELRRRNLVRDGDRFIAGGRLKDLHFGELLDRAASAVGWQTRVGRQQRGAGTRRVGRSVIPTLKTTLTPSFSNALLKLNGDGSLMLLTGTVEMGQGARTALSQIAAQALGVPVGSVTVAQVDTDVVPNDPGTVSSRSTFSTGTAIIRAADALRDQLRALAAEHLEVAPTDLTFGQGRAVVRGAPNRSLSFGELVERSGRSELVGHGSFITQGVPDPITGQPGMSARWHHGVVAAEVMVDCETGRIAVNRLWAGVYVGTIVNPIMCELQAHGSLLFGLGEALFEQMQMADGALLTTSLAEYNLPSFRDVPADLPTVVLEEPGAMEVHGVGETLVPPVMAAIGSAVADAVGVRPRDLPLTPERILAALHDRIEEPTMNHPQGP